MNDDALVREHWGIFFGNVDKFGYFCKQIHQTNNTMKKALILMMLLVSMAAAAQNNDGKRPVYCDVMAYNFWGIGKVRIILDMGDRKRGQSFETIYEPDGKQKKFNTVMEALNYMGERGWRVIDTYVITEMKSNVLHYLMEKWISDESERKEGLLLKESKLPTYDDDTYFVPEKKEKE